MPRAAVPVLLATSIGVGLPGESPPGLVDPSRALVGHLELGLEDPSGHARVAVAASLARAWYDNTIPPPDGTTPRDSVILSRAGFGVVAEGRLPLGRITPVAGGGLYFHRTSARAEGTVLGIRGTYYDEHDDGFGVEARAGADLQLSGAVEIGVRGGWTWARADLPDLVHDGAVGGPSIELRLTLDLTGFRHDATPDPAIPP
jgi:hypothetical protein